MAKPDLTPENIIALYQKHDLRAVTCIMGTYLNDDGAFEKVEDGAKCCALGVYTLGKKVEGDVEDIFSRDSLESAASLADVDMWAFVCGFDDPLDYVRQSERRNHPDYVLGRACRKAVEEAGLLD